MKYNLVGKSQLRMSEVGLGCWTIGGPYWTDGEPTGWSGDIDEQDVVSAIRYAVDRGVTHFDTADVYGYGRSERLLGKALKGLSDTTVVATKVGFAATTAPHVYDPLNIERQCEQSLRNLQRDSIDIYYLHQCDFGDDDQYLDGAIEALKRLQSSGKIREIGLSGYSTEELTKVIPRLQPALVQSWADIEHDEFVRTDAPLTKLLEEYDAKFVAMMPFGQGRLLGKYASANPPEFGDGDNRNDSDGFTAESLATLAPRLEALQARFGGTPEDLVRVALGFVLAQPRVASVIPGFRTLKQVEMNLAPNSYELSEEDINYIYSVFPREEMPPHPWA